ncbi:MFS transporter [Maridesulfovibrio sp.]|uniref:MFS transporter n=1 Tax=Maridesulfovibrio sp. TaxID=2795000 RepID=UPI002A1880A6|nr:MFS transporter [Maridesulfovibrio sp.]
MQKSRISGKLWRFCRMRLDLFWRGMLDECSESRRRTAQGVLAAAFFSTLGVGAFTFAMSLSAGSSGLSSYWLGLAFSGYFLARLVLAPLAGYCADFIGPMPMLLTATGLGAAVPLLQFFFPATETLGVIQISLGFCSGIVKPVSMSLLGDCVPDERRGRLFGAYNTFLYAALVTGPLVGGLAVNLQGGIQSLILFCPGVGMGLAFLAFLRASTSSPVSSMRKDKAKGGPPWRDMSFLSLLLAVLGRTTGASVVITFLPRLINERFGLDGMLAGLLFALPNIMIIVGMPVTSRWADVRDKSGLTFLGMGICAACLFAFGQPVSVWSFAGLAALMGFGSALSLPASMSLASEMGPAKGSVMGVFLGASNLGFVLGPALSGLAVRNGGMADAFELVALFSGLCLLPTFLVMSRRLYAE